jgi:glycosyltransferase involved in cell wall biosynthesis
MKVNFWSSTEYSGFMAGLIRELNARGHAAKQSFAISEASYRSAKSPFARLLLRFRQYIAYPFFLVCSLGRACFSSAKKNGSRDFMVVSTNTFYAPLIATFFHRRVVHLVYDLFPEAMIHSGKWKEGSLKVSCIRFLVKHTLQRAKSNVFLGSRLKDYVESIHGEIPNATIIAIGADQSLFPVSPSQRSAEVELSRSQQLLYCGNFGNMHESDTLLGYWAKCAEDSIYEAMPRFKFSCSGPKRASLATAVSKLPTAIQEKVYFGDGLGQAEWITAMQSAEIALVTMSPGAETVVMPSKTYSAMMAGQAILAIAPEDSDLVDLIKKAECGWWVEPGDVDGLEKAIQAISDDPKELMACRERAYQYAQAHYGQADLAKEWAALFEQLDA